MPTMLAETTAKGFRHGTHRVCAPEQTWERVRRHLAACGITRVADVTRLDVIGIPVFQAVRPLSRNLSVSQGKGVTPMLARVSAVMEAVELWHAEDVSHLDATRARVADMSLHYDPHTLDLAARSLLGGATVLHWVPGRTLRTGRSAAVPREYLEIDHTLAETWQPPLFRVTSNGLSSGNTVEEAVLHGLYEVIERDALTRLQAVPRSARRAVDPDTVDGEDAAPLLAALRDAGCTVSIVDATGPTGLPTFVTEIWSAGYPHWFGGAGCHLDREVALCRALTEAAQSRLTAVAGTRDDVQSGVYTRVTDWCAQPGSRAGGISMAFATVPDAPTGDLAADLQAVAAAVEELSGVEPFAVDLTRDHIGIPVVRVVAPGMLHGKLH